MTRIDLPSAYAPLPHDLITDPAVTAPAVRLYGLLHKYGWERRDAHIEGLSSELRTTDRSIYRWLAELAAARWIAYTRRPGQRGLTDRIQLFDKAQPPPEPPATSDMGVRAAANTSDTTIRSSDTTIRSSDTTIRGSDTTIRGSDTTIRGSDRGVRGEGVLPHQDAVKNTTQSPERSSEDPEGGGGGHARANRLQVPLPFEPPESPGHTLLAAEGFCNACVHQFGHLDPALLATDIQRRRSLGQREGAIYLAWKVAPPGTYRLLPAPEESHDQPPGSPHPARDSGLARALRKHLPAADQRPAPARPPAARNDLSDEEYACELAAAERDAAERITRRRRTLS